MARAPADATRESPLPSTGRARPRIDLLHSHAWQVSIGRFIVLLLAALVAGSLVGAPVAALALALFGYSVWSLVSLYRLQRWLRARRRATPPEDLGVWSDVSEFMFRKLERERSRKRRLVRTLRAFREAAAALPDGVVVTTRGESILWLNRSATRLLGLGNEPFRGRALEEIVPAAAREWLAAGATDALMDVAAPHDEALRLSLRVIRYANDQAMLVVRDISHLMRLEQVRRDFVANVSHELRTPLTVLHGYLDMLEPGDAPEWAPVLDDLRGQSRRMAQIVEDLLTLSRLESRRDLPEDRVVMAALLEDLRREAEGLSQRRHEFVVEGDRSLDLRGSQQYLHSAFSNLVSNAVRYTPQGGRITIRWQRDGDGARFSVTDTGYGIPPEHLPRIAERFYRVSTSRSRATGGTGLGLSIVKHVLNVHQARLEVASEVGTGSTFSCVFEAERLLERHEGEAA